MIREKRRVRERRGEKEKREGGRIREEKGNGRRRVE